MELKLLLRLKWWMVLLSGVLLTSVCRASHHDEVTLGLAVGVAQGPRTEGQSSPWKLVWSDEFNGAELNTSAWNVRTNQTHCCGCASSLVHFFQWSCARP